MRSILYEQVGTSSSDVGLGALTRNNKDTTRILNMFDTVFDQSSQSVPVSTFVEFIRLHFSSRWASFVGDFIDNGCILFSPREESGVIKEIDSTAVDDDGIKQCVNMLAPMDIQEFLKEAPSGRESSMLSGIRVLTLKKDR